MKLTKCKYIILLLSLFLSLNTASVSFPVSNNEKITIGIYSGQGASEACIVAAENMFEWMGYEIKRFYAKNLEAGDLNDIDLFYFPGGNPFKYIDFISAKGKQRIRQRIKSGVGYIGTCAGAGFAAEQMKWRDELTSQDSLGIFPGISEAPNPRLFKFQEIGMSKVNLVKPHAITDSESAFMWILNYNSPFFTVSEGSKVDIIARYDITEQLAMVACSYGKGRVFLIGLHPEWEEDSDRDGISRFDNFDDQGSDWPLMKNVVRWCLHEIN